MGAAKHSLELGEVIPIEKINSVLRGKREQIARAANDANGLRVCTINLVAFCNHEERCAQTLEVLSHMVVEHPGRHFLVHAHREAKDTFLTARVAVDATPTAPGVPPTYSELIDLNAHGDANVELLAPVLTSLLESDQPAIAWWATPPHFGPTWVRTSHLADRMVVDSGELDPWDLMRLVEYVKSDSPAAGVDDHSSLGDLNWARIKPFMAATAKFFDAPLIRERFATLDRVVVQYAPPQGSFTPVAAAMLAAWVRGRLRKAAKAARVKIAPVVEIQKVDGTKTPPGEVHELVLSSSAADGLELAVGRADGMLLAEARKGCASLAPQRSRLHTSDPTWLLAQELQIYGRDPVFEAALIDAIDILRDARR